MTLKESLDKFGLNQITDARANLKNRAYHGFIKNNTGSLYDSISYKIIADQDTMNVDFDMNDYGYIVDQGRLPGKGVPVDSLEKWLKSRGLSTDLSYIINRKIKTIGIAPTDFFSEPFDVNNKKNTFDLMNNVDFLGFDENIDDIFETLDKELNDVIIGRKKK